MDVGLGFRVQGLGLIGLRVYRVWGLWGLEFRVPHHNTKHKAQKHADKQ